MEFKAKDRRLEGDTILRQCQLTELYLLDVFVEICEKYKLTYFLDSGTLLGAVRHKGFIPWDDDLDLCMPRKDYRVFLKVAAKELPDGILLIPSTACGRTHVHAKLRDCSSFFCEKDTSVENPSGIFIDIFPFERSPKVPCWIGFPLLKTMGIAAGSLVGNLKAPKHSIFGLIKCVVMSVCWFALFNALKIPYVILRLICPTVWRYSPELGSCIYHEGFPSEVVFPLSTVEFEGRCYAAPHNVERYLTTVYGDWRTPPPPEKRKWHASIILPAQAPNVWWARPYAPV